MENTFDYRVLVCEIVAVIARVCIMLVQVYTNNSVYYPGGWRHSAQGMPLKGHPILHALCHQLWFHSLWASFMPGGVEAQSAQLAR